MSRTKKDASAKETKCKDIQDTLQKESRVLEEMLNETENMHLVYLDRDFNFVRVNEAYAKTCGYKPEEMIGKNHFALYPDEEVEAIFKCVRDTGVSTKFHDRPFVFPDQPERGVTYWDWTLNPVKDGSGKVESLVFSLVETTERKKTEEALIQTQNRLSIATEAARIGIHDYDIVANTVRWDERIRKIWGVEPDEPVTYETFIENVHPDDRAAVQAEMNRALDPKKGEFYAEYRVFNRKDKTVRWVYATGKTFFDNNHKPVRLIGTAEDITERKKVEEALWQQAQLLYLSYDAIIMWRKDGAIEHWNRGAEQLYGYTESEALGRVTHKLLKTIHPVPWSKIEAAMRKHGQWEGELRHHAKDGHEVTVSARHQLVLGTDGIERILETNRDITERKRAEKELKVKDNAIASSVNAIAIADVQGRLTYINPAFMNLWGYEDKREVLGKSVLDFWEEPARAREVVQVIQDSGSWTGELVGTRRDGSHLNLYLSASTVLDEDGAPICMIASFVDITERKKAEEALLRSERKYRRLYETSQDGIMARDLQGRMINCNQAYLRMLGYSKRELKTLSVNRLLPEKWRRHRDEVYKQIVETGVSKVFEREYIRKDGSVFSASVRSWPLTDDSERVVGVWSIVRDISELKKTEEELRRAEWVSRHRAEELEVITAKLEDKAAEVEEYATNMEELAKERADKLKDAERLAAIGATAGMVGHDIRNPLQSIVGDLYLIASDVSSFPEGEEKESIKESIGAIRKNIDYIDKIIQDLQDYAKSHKPDLRRVDLEEIFQKLFLETNFPENVKTKYCLEEDAREIVADPALVERIVRNLVINAVQAMPEGGKLEIQSRSENGEVILTVEDSGVGIAEDAKDKLFTPLFTTKAKGQGFGLPVVKRMTEALGGTVTFESEEGKGTKFIVRLPVTNSER